MLLMTLFGIRIAFLLHADHNYGQGVVTKIKNITSEYSSKSAARAQLLLNARINHHNYDYFTTTETRTNRKPMAQIKLRESIFFSLVCIRFVPNCFFSIKLAV